MNEVASILGINLPIVSSRNAVMRERFNRQVFRQDKHFPIICQRDSLLVHKSQCDCKDDDTACTVSSSECGVSVDTPHSVSFAENLVTEVYTRPYTTINEKQRLFYSDWEYLEFRRNAYCSNNGRERLVQFADDVVSEVWIIPTVSDSSSMYYSERELQSFLDEFIASLGEQ